MAQRAHSELKLGSENPQDADESRVISTLTSAMCIHAPLMWALPSSCCHCPRAVVPQCPSTGSSRRQANTRFGFPPRTATCVALATAVAAVRSFAVDLYRHSATLVSNGIWSFLKSSKEGSRQVMQSKAMPGELPLGFVRRVPKGAIRKHRAEGLCGKLQEEPPTIGDTRRGAVGFIAVLSDGNYISRRQSHAGQGLHDGGRVLLFQALPHLQSVVVDYPAFVKRLVLYHKGM